MHESDSNIGRWAVLFHNNLLHVGIVIDLVAGTDKPKRIRIQRGPLQGVVVQPHEYVFKHWLDETDIDP